MTELPEFGEFGSRNVDEVLHADAVGADIDTIGTDVRQSALDTDLELSARAVFERHDTLRVAAEDGVGLLARVRPAGRADADFVGGAEVDLSGGVAFEVVGGGVVRWVLLELRVCWGVVDLPGDGGNWGDDVGGAVWVLDGGAGCGREWLIVLDMSSLTVCRRRSLGYQVV